MTARKAARREALRQSNELFVYDGHSGKLVRTLGHASAVTAAAFAPREHAILSGTADGTLWITRDDDDPPELLARVGARIDAVDLMPDGRALVADKTPRLHVYDTRSHARLAELPLPGSMRTAGFRTSPDGRRLLVLLGTVVVGALPLLDLERYQIIAQLDHRKGAVFSARFLDDRPILTAANDGTARIWDAERGELRREFLDRSTWLTEAAVDPAGRMLVTGGGDGILRFWDLASGRKVWSLRAHRKTIVAMHFDGSDLLTRSRDGELARWRLPPLPSSQELTRGMDRVLRCLPVRFDEASGGLAEQAQDCEFPRP